MLKHTAIIFAALFVFSVCLFVPITAQDENSNIEITDQKLCEQAGRIWDGGKCRVLLEQGPYNKDETEKSAPVETNETVPEDKTVVANDDKQEILPVDGIVYFSSVPEGAKVLIGGKEKGVTPVTVKDIKTGEHDVELKRDGYEARKIRLKANADGENANKVTRLEIELQPAYGTLEVKTDREPALVFLDGEFRGETPLMITDAMVGSHRIVVEKNEYKKEYEVVVSEAGSELVEVSFQEGLGGITVLSEPQGAQVRVDGLLQGVTPLTVENIPEGEHLVEAIDAAQGLGWRGSVLVKSGSTDILEWKLKPMTGGLEVTSSPAGAEVYVDSQKRGVTPLKLSALIEDSYQVKIYKKGFHEEVRQVEVKSKGIAKKHFDLVKVTCPDGYVYIRAGRFYMGSPLSEQKMAFDECERTGGKGMCGPPPYGWYANQVKHEVVLTSDFCMKKAEVTNAEYMKCVKTGACRDPYLKGSCWIQNGAWDWKSVYELPEELKAPNKPVVCVSWDMAADYAAWKGTSYRLPTESEWEYTARADSIGTWYWGPDSSFACDYENFNTDDWVSNFKCDDGYSTAAPVMSFKPNPWGVYDILGNVSEWVYDYDSTYPAGPVIDPKGPVSGSRRIGRGGSWNSFGYITTAAYRASSAPENRLSFMGFRLVRTLP